MSLINVPQNWRAIKLEDISDIRRGASPRPIGNKKFFGGNIGWIRISDLGRNGKYLNETEQYLSKLGVEKSVSVYPEEVILSICASIGKPSILKIDACIHDGFLVFKNLKKDILNEFLYYSLLNISTMLREKKQTGTQSNLNSSIVKQTQILLPPYNEQLKITNILLDIDSKIENANKIIKITKKLKQGFLQQLLTKGIGHTEFKETSLGRIPKEWEVVKIRDVVNKINYGTSKKCNYNRNNIPVLRIPNISNGTINHNDMKYTKLSKSEFEKLSLKEGDFLIIRSNGNISLVGRSALVTSNEIDYCFAGYLIRLRINQKYILTEFLNQLFQSRIIRNQIETVARSTSGINNINSKEISNLNIVLPKLNEQKKIVEIVANGISYIDINRKAKNKLIQLKKGLMQQLLTGKIRIKIKGS